MTRVANTLTGAETTINIHTQHHSGINVNTLQVSPHSEYIQQQNSVLPQSFQL